jgi:serine/threonine protein kinase
MTEEQVFLAAVELADPAERTTYLDEACGRDVDFRRQVEELLAAHFKPGPFLDEPFARQMAAGLATPISLNTASMPGAGGGEAEPALEKTDKETNDLPFLQPSTRADALGRIGHYEVLEVLGKGGFGIVLRAFDETLQRVVALKVLAPVLAATSSARKRFLHEARSSAQVRHENVVQVYAVEEQPLPYLVMEFIPGETLQKRLDRVGSLETPEIVRIGRQLAEGLAAAHAQGLVHRDIKPGNILLETVGREVNVEAGRWRVEGEDPPATCHAPPATRVKITDFGLARAADDASLTQSGVLSGTPMYMAPEQAKGEAIDDRADLFSLGSVMYVMATGRPPFRASTTFGVLRRVAEDQPRPIREVIPEVPEWLGDIIGKLHAKKPDDRFHSAREVADLLRDEGGGMRDEKRPKHDSVSSLIPHPSSLRGWPAAAAILLLLLGGLSITEATGVTDVRGTVIRLVSPEGTLVVEVDDPGVSVKIDGSDVVITGAGTKEIRLRPGKYTVEASKDGQVVRQELVTVTKDGREVVRVSQEPPPDTKAAQAAQVSQVAAWERAVAALPATKQAEAVAARLKELNPGFDGRVQPTIENGAVTGLAFETEHVRDIAPVRACTKLKSIDCCGGRRDYHIQGLLVDLSPLRGLPLTNVRIITSPVSDLSPLSGMALTHLHVERTQVSNLTPLKGMPLRALNLYSTPVADLTPLAGMPLVTLLATHTQVSDLSPLKGLPLENLQYSWTGVADLTPLTGMPLRVLACDGTPVTDLSPVAGLPLATLHCGSSKVTDAGLERFKDCKDLTYLALNDTQVSDAGLAYLKDYTNLKEFRADGTKVTGAGIDELKKTLPKCTIRWDGGVIMPR